MRDVDRGQPFRNNDGRNKLARERCAGPAGYAIRACDVKRRLPVRSWVEVRQVPASRHLSRVEVLAAVNRGECDRSGCYLPAGIAGHGCLCTVLVRDVHLQDELRLTEGTDPLAVSIADVRNVIHPVTHHHAESVVAGLELRGYIKSVVQDLFTVVGPAWVENGGGDISPVQVQLILPKP